MGKKVQAMTFEEVIVKHQEKALKEAIDFEKNGGMCLNCGKHPGQVEGLNPHRCEECNEETEKLLAGLRGPGFMEFRMPKKGV